ncbi:histidine phosphatase family protein [Lentibacillus sp. Marseille-P4043]|uniref:histidine phosphatase family protein n=1 Tax=Lentibacillus sp. Marseille-P4043 TaxID=2040293 RepID=UPI00131A4974|nr:histidine phosphatase family protein [Lentibacillus sp. Marseille-P4043]
MDDDLAITLLRHGMTTANQKGTYIGWTDTPLSTKGCNDLCINLPKQDLIFSSDLTRCLETAAILFPSQPVQALKEMREMNFGAWEGKTYDQLKHLPAYRHWLDNPYTASPDGGESFAAFGDRIRTGFTMVKKQILDSDAKDSAIVTHGGVIRYLLSVFSGQNRSFFEWKIPYGGGYRLCWLKDDFRREKACTLLQAVPTMENPRG